MVDVSTKPNTQREAIAEAWVRVGPEAFRAIVEGSGPKGDVLATARLAGIQGAKQTAQWIPLCHPLPLDAVSVLVEPEEGAIHIRATVRTHWRTGVEMEAMTAVSAAALTVYDMIKAVDRGTRIEGVRLLEKRGGRSGEWISADR
jgi:cyclic pyranopterin phosphate synthase